MESSLPFSINNHALADVPDEQAFMRVLSLERRRTERSGRRFVLMLLESATLVRSAGTEHQLAGVMEALSRSIRETDIVGRYDKDSVGIIFTEIGTAESKAVASALMARVVGALSRVLGIEELNEIRISFHVFPENSGMNGSSRGADLPLYPELGFIRDSRRISRGVKRAIDIAGSLAGLLVLSPVFAAIAVFVKLTSAGPVIFRQERVGQYGNRFTFLKFRSMYVANDHSVHKHYVRQFISGAAPANGSAGAQTSVYKITDDTRVTRFGRFLRRSSLDELPQLFNVLLGEMSLVGPRPPVPYEFEYYEAWHKARLMSVKPGITGLWQVGGRSKIKFDEMVRLDLQYARTWSIGLDLKILLRTPRAVLSREGAY
jgi:lipopolysaccharide/colanic/teichoic acid biosynthesis glycosyltransferase/GGDEF domain-containing protein